MAQIAIYNDANTILIDDEYVNNTLVSKYSLQFGPTITVGFGFYYNFSITTPSAYGQYPPIVALYKSDGFIAIGRILTTRSGDDWVRTYKIVGDVTNSNNFELFVFGIPQQSVGVGEGLVVLRNAQGQVTFDSGLKYLRVVDFIDYRGMNRYGSASLTKSYKPGRKYAFIYSQYQIWFGTNASPGGIGDTMAVAARPQGDGIYIGAHWMKRTTARPEDAPYTRNDGLKLMVIDVTGL